MNKKLLIATAGTLLLVAPMAALAFSAGNTPSTNTALTLEQLVQIIFDIIWIVFVAFAVVMFIIAGFTFLTAQGEPEGVGKARQFVIWGAVGVAVAVLAFSIPYAVRNTVGG